MSREMKHLFLLVFGVCGLPLLAQNYSSQDPAYAKNVELGFAAMTSGDCASCLKHYREAFAISEKSALSMTRAIACAFDCDEDEFVKTYLAKAVGLDWAVVEEVFQHNEEFKKYQATELAEMVMLQCVAQKKALGLDLELMAVLTRIQEEDQLYRRGFGGSQNGLTEQELIAKMMEADARNLKEIIDILDSRGYPGRSRVGGRLNSTAWLVIQHADPATQEMYLPMMRDAAEQDEMPKSNLALLIDRIRMHKNEKQIYGSQVRREEGTGGWTLHPIENPDAVNVRRAEMGLAPIEDYLKNWSLDWEKEKVRMKSE
jgi:hypothetical protein